MSEHTYLLEEAEWLASVKYWDEQNKLIQGSGTTTIKHSDSKWHLSGKMNLDDESPIEIENCYEITPFKKEKKVTRWTSVNPKLGRLNGTFTIIEDHILSQFTSEDGQFRGSEVLIQIDAQTYRNSGVLFAGQRQLSSWTALIKRKI